MDMLRRRALARLALTEEEVRRLYTAGGERPKLLGDVATLCESHERLRAELQGAEVLLEDQRRAYAELMAACEEMMEFWRNGTPVHPGAEVVADLWAAWAKVKGD